MLLLIGFWDVVVALKMYFLLETDFIIRGAHKWYAGARACIYRLMSDTFMVCLSPFTAVHLNINYY